MKTTSYKISKKLAEIGFETKAMFYYHVNPNGTLSYIAPQIACSDVAGILNVKSYDLETILENLPEAIEGLMLEMNLYFGFMQYANYDGGEIVKIDFTINRNKDESLADTAARLLILLIDKTIIKFDKND